MWLPNFRMCCNVWLFIIKLIISIITCLCYSWGWSNSGGGVGKFIRDLKKLHPPFLCMNKIIPSQACKIVSPPPPVVIFYRYPNSFILLWKSLSITYIKNVCQWRRKSTPFFTFWKNKFNPLIIPPNSPPLQIFSTHHHQYYFLGACQKLWLGVGVGWS